MSGPGDAKARVAPGSAQSEQQQAKRQHKGGRAENQGLVSSNGIGG
jgi:hypothetical protein